MAPKGQAKCNAKSKMMALTAFLQDACEDERSLDHVLKRPQGSPGILKRPSASQVQGVSKRPAGIAGPATVHSKPSANDVDDTCPEDSATTEVVRDRNKQTFFLKHFEELPKDVQDAYEEATC